ncbi:MAG: hypothetical protein J3R72DRAFT_526226 [Linnemannia gamsii]|nr:MAG: hypothetical protein J3R72DRAFT_526226 [Linnemannia gamsii]
MVRLHLSSVLLAALTIAQVTIPFVATPDQAPGNYKITRPNSELKAIIDSSSGDPAVGIESAVARSWVPTNDDASGNIVLQRIPGETDKYRIVPVGNQALSVQVDSSSTVVLQAKLLDSNSDDQWSFTRV